MVHRGTLKFGIDCQGRQPGLLTQGIQIAERRAARSLRFSAGAQMPANGQSQDNG